MGKRRSAEVELCFDSMTDLITNLAGGLILVVLLLLGLTREASSEAPPTPPKLTEEKRDLADKSIRPLLDRVSRLQLETQEVDRQVQALEKALPSLEQEVEELMKQAGPAKTVTPAKASKK